MECLYTPRRPESGCRSEVHAHADRVTPSVVLQIVELDQVAVVLLQAILDATNNSFFVQLHEPVNTALRISIRFTNRIEDRTASVRVHEAVMKAIIARDPERAAVAMRGIVNEVLKLIAAAGRKT